MIKAAQAAEMLGMSTRFVYGLHEGPAVDCIGRTSEDARQDRALNDEMKRLWNTQPATPGAEGAV